MLIVYNKMYGTFFLKLTFQLSIIKYRLVTLTLFSRKKIVEKFVSLKTSPDLIYDFMI